MTRTQIKVWAKTEWDRQMAQRKQEIIEEWQAEQKTNRTPTEDELRKWEGEKPLPF